MRTRIASSSRRRGFTLLELLVAISVLSIVSLIAWRGLDSLVQTRERLEPDAEEVRLLLVAFGQIERDLAQVVNTAFVPLHRAPFSAYGGAQPGFELVRLAAATGGEPSTIQFVAYELRDGRLVRRASTPVDTIGATTGLAFSSLPLLDDVAAMRLRVWQPGRGWAPPEAMMSANLPGPPPGLELVLERTDGRQYRRVLLLG